MYQEQDLLYRCTDQTRTVVQLAAALSRKLGHSDVQPQDILNALLHYQWPDWPAEFETIISRLPPAHINSTVDDTTLKKSDMLVRVIAEAKKEAHSVGETYIGNEHLLLGLMRIHPEIVLNAETVRAAVMAISKPAIDSPIP
jgi:ATP-dependent Clp protease ATP-binding subunit ClpA